MPASTRVVRTGGPGSDDRLEQLALAPCNERDARLVAAAKLSNAQVAAIRAAYTAGGVTQKALAARYGIHQTQISAIVRGLQHRQHG